VGLPVESLLFYNQGAFIIRVPCDTAPQVLPNSELALTIGFAVWAAGVGAKSLAQRQMPLGGKVKANSEGALYQGANVVEHRCGRLAASEGLGKRRERRLFNDSARSRSLKLLTKGFCMGLHGAM
jgi:hypothetical protein